MKLKKKRPWILLVLSTKGLIMPKEFRPGFIYIKSAELNQEVAFSLKSGWIYCEDRGPDGKLVNYSPEEMEILKASESKKITPGVHGVKKIFGGRIVKYEEPGSSNKGKSDAGKKSNSTADNSYSGGKIPEATGNGPNFKPGELDIY
jgi:hypothetical protein